MKKILVILLALLMMFSFASCNNEVKEDKPVSESTTYEFKTFKIELPKGLTVTASAEDEFDEFGFILSCPHYEFKDGDSLILSIDIGGIGDITGERFETNWCQGFVCDDGVYIFPEDDYVNWCDYIMVIYSDYYSLDELKDIALTIEPIRVPEL